WAFLNRPMDSRSEQSEADRNPPHRIVRVGHVVKPAGKPQSGERSDLMGQEHESKQHRHPRRSKERGDEAAGERYGGQPEQAEHRAKRNHHRAIDREKEKTEEHEAAHEIDDAEPDALLDESRRLPKI